MNTYQVVVPIAGHVIIEIESDNEPEVSTFFGEDSTPFEDEVVSTASDRLAESVTFVSDKGLLDWQLEVYAALSRGNVRMVDVGEIEVLEEM